MISTSGRAPSPWRRRIAAVAATTLAAAGIALAGSSSAATTAVFNPFEANQGFSVVAKGNVHLGNPEIEGSVAAFGSISSSNQNGYPVIHKAAGKADYTVPTVDGTPVRILAQEFVGKGAFDVSNRDDSKTLASNSAEALATVKLASVDGLVGTRRGGGTGPASGKDFLRVTNPQGGVIDLKTTPYQGSSVSDLLTEQSTVSSYFAGLDERVERTNTCLSQMYADSALANRVSLTNEWGMVFPTGFADDRPNVIDYADVANANVIKMERAGRYVPTAVAPLVIKVPAGTQRLGQLRIEGWSAQESAQQAYARYIMFDLSEVTGTVIIDGLELGAIWAPKANLTFNSGVTTNGQWFVGGDITTAGGGEVHHHTFLGQLLCAAPEGVDPVEPTEHDPRIGTTVEVVGSTDKVLPLTGGTVRDEVVYEGLVPGATYTLAGSIHTVPDGTKTDIAATAEFTVPEDAENGSGKTFVDFVVSADDIAAYAGRDLVVFEHLTRDGQPIAEHADLEDAAQTFAVEEKSEPTGPTDPANPGEGDGSTDPETANPGEGGEPTDPTDPTDPDNPGEGGGSTDPETSNPGSVESDPSIATTVQVQGVDGKVLPLTGGILLDTVEFSGLVEGVTYVLEGEVHVVATGEPTGITAVAEFVAPAAAGSTVVEFVVTAEQVAAYAGQELVVFETLTRGGEFVAEHADVEDEAQTFSVEEAPESTDPTDPTDPSNPSEGGEPTDPSNPSEGGEPTDPVNTGEGGEPTEPTDPTDPSEGGEPTDPIGPVVPGEQSPRIGTTVEVAGSDVKVLPLSGGVVRDVVAYEGLVPGVTYVLTGEVRTVPEGDKTGIEATAEFTPEAASGETVVEFVVKAKEIEAYAGQDLVVFEFLTRDGKAVAEHADAEDEAQTFSVAEAPESTDPTDPTDPSNPGEGGESTDPTDPSNPGDGGEPTDPTEPGTSGGGGATDPGTDPDGPDPEGTDEPGGSGEETEPTDPATPGEPGTSGGGGSTDPGTDPEGTDPEGIDPEGTDEPGEEAEPTDPIEVKEDGTTADGSEEPGEEPSDTDSDEPVDGKTPSGGGSDQSGDDTSDGGTYVLPNAGAPISVGTLVLGLALILAGGLLMRRRRSAN